MTLSPPSGALTALIFSAALLAPASAVAEPPPDIALPEAVPPHISEAVEELYALDETRILELRTDLARQDVARCDIDVCVDPGRGWLSGSTRLRFATANGRIEFELHEALTILSLVDGAGRDVPFQRTARAVTARLDAQRGDSPPELTVSYEGLLRPAGDTAAEYHLMILLGDDCWYACPRRGDRSHVRAVVRHPGEYATVFSGALAGMATPPSSRPGPCSFGDVWEAESVDRASAVIGELRGSWNIVGELFIGTHRYSGKDGEEGATQELRPLEPGIKQPLQFLESCFGSYPLTWLHVVIVPHGTIGAPAVSGSGLIIVEARPTDAACANAPEPGLYLLELARTWWRDAYDAGPVLADGLAGHMEIQWLESVRGEEDALRRRALRQGQYLRAVTDSGGFAPLSLCLGPAASRDSRISLGRGGALMGICSTLLGPDAFCGFVRGLVTDGGSEPPSLRRFGAELTAAAGRNMDWLLYEWIQRGDLPVYALEYESSPSRGGYLVRGTLRQLAEPYRTPLPLTVDLGGWVYDEWIPVGSAQQAFEFRTELEPLEVVIDAARIIPRVESADQARVHFELGRRAASQNRWADAVDHFGAAVALDPDRAGYHARYGQALVRLGRPDEGFAALGEAIERDPTDADYLFEAGVLALQIGDARAAVELLGRHVNLRPDHPAGHVELAVALVERGRLPEARTHLDRCPALVGETPDDAWLERYHIAFGRYSEARGERDQALSAYEAALEVNPVSDEARRRLAELGER